MAVMGECSLLALETTKLGLLDIGTGSFAILHNEGWHVVYREGSESRTTFEEGQAKDREVQIIS